MSETSPAANTSPPFDRTDWLALALLLAAFAVARVTVFPFAENLYGDSVVRSEIAERWANEPRLYASFKDGVFQFGPLHFYATGLALKAWPSREHAPRLVSLVMGLLLVVPVYRLGRRLFSRRAAIAAGLAMSAWSLHIQASTTAASEAMFLTLLFFALDFLFRGIEEERFAPMAVAALFVNLFCALRYDGWMLGPMLVLAVALSGRDRVASATRSLLFGALCAPFPLWWMQGNEQATGDPLFPIHYIDAYHANWVKAGTAWLGEPLQRTASLLFFPGTVLVTASLLVGLFALIGLVRAIVGGERRALALLAVAPAAYYAFRGAVLLDFSPLARFFMAPTAIALMFLDSGFRASCGRLPPFARRAVAGLAAAVALGTVVFLGASTAWRDGTRADTLRPIAPLSTIPVPQRATVDFLKANMGPGEALIVDESPDYVDITVAFFTGLPEERLARRRWGTIDEVLRSRPDAAWLLLAGKGVLAEEERLAPGTPLLDWRGSTWQLAFAAPPSLFAYRRDPAPARPMIEATGAASPGAPAALPP